MSSSWRVRWNRKNSCVCSAAERGFLIEALQERILVGLLENQLAAEAARQPPGEAGLADADRPFDHDQAMRRWNGDFSVMSTAKLFKGRRERR